METSVIRSKIQESVKKWASAEETRVGKLRVKPEVILRFLPSYRKQKRVTTQIALYHKPKGKEPIRSTIQTTNSFGELVLALEIILDEWRRLTDYA